MNISIFVMQTIRTIVCPRIQRQYLNPCNHGCVFQGWILHLLQLEDQTPAKPANTTENPLNENENPINAIESLVPLFLKIDLKITT